MHKILFVPPNVTAYQPVLVLRKFKLCLRQIESNWLTLHSGKKSLFYHCARLTNLMVTYEGRAIVPPVLA